jgi:hypothetical protein
VWIVDVCVMPLLMLPLFLVGEAKGQDALLEGISTCLLFTVTHGCGGDAGTLLTDIVSWSTLGRSSVSSKCVDAVDVRIDSEPWDSREIPEEYDGCVVRDV